MNLYYLLPLRHMVPRDFGSRTTSMSVSLDFISLIPCCRQYQASLSYLQHPCRHRRHFRRLRHRLKQSAPPGTLGNEAFRSHTPAASNARLRDECEPFKQRFQPRSRWTAGFVFSQFVDWYTEQCDSAIRIWNTYP